MSTLYVVATPIGNLSDMTFRAVEILSCVDLILSEDTRETDKILKHYNIQKPQISYRDQNHERVLPRIYETLDSGKEVALVSDSGTPTISDPGFKLVSSVIDKGYKVLPIPGPSAIVSALSISGLPTDKFTFLGFLPRGANQIKELLETYGKLEATLVVYESPYRVKTLLHTIYDVLGNRKVCLAKDMTKMFEDIRTADIEEILRTEDQIVEKGEYVVLIAKEGF
ncbi:MAG: 16S rRNA (cytidine(1402)-2'-O)-methyltransferase [Patescibacteria group bacterium]|jgi:16S rRNA (cytidine1402-2'-O)-methyltransferase